MNEVKNRGETTLVFGGARSGKSHLGEAIIAREEHAAIYIATAQAHDGEMAERIAAHRARRQNDATAWRTREIPIDLAPSLPDLLAAGQPILIDCLTLWLSNIMLAEHDVEAALEALWAALARAQAPLVLISNETGLGIVPENALARRFRDYSGIMNRKAAEQADNVLFVAAGLPLVMKGRNPLADSD
ncbi:MAG: bifunctional adenosylcobinamide kinase/adenosylcobinamide-phosphate guanylyltransferase [Alphaproteobacteria bacterium]|jgi:adenosylcobinamide kinase/adenosylcobinamide-phosphate guanylyltransferase|nr:bifunctional adenosylcobinamide kinase/adenosylcobinamide-phosphate guanylyltransferase [Alphaproteobacteria bacterium]